jgi:hypothetical protein
MTGYATTSAAISRSRLLLWRVCKWLVLSVALIVAAGAVFQLSMSQWERYRYPPPGKLVDIGGLRLHINCTGAGSPTVILEAGPTESSVIWQLVQPQIGSFTRVCSYDRAGFGWSDAPNAPRTASNIANELDRLLNRAAVPGPYVLVGHDFGGLINRDPPAIANKASYKPTNMKWFSADGSPSSIKLRSAVACHSCVSACWVG